MDLRPEALGRVKRPGARNVLKRVSDAIESANRLIFNPFSTFERPLRSDRERHKGPQWLDRMGFECSRRMVNRSIEAREVSSGGARTCHFDRFCLKTHAGPLKRHRTANG